MKEKQLTITSNNISQKQWSNLILELNLIKKAWSSYATLNIKAPGIKKIIAHGTQFSWLYVPLNNFIRLTRKLCVSFHTVGPFRIKTCY